MQLDVEESTPADIIPIDFTLELHLAIVMIVLMRFPGSAPEFGDNNQEMTYCPVRNFGPVTNTYMVL